jgi:hypothetical protein
MTQAVDALQNPRRHPVEKIRLDQVNPVHQRGIHARI